MMVKHNLDEVQSLNNVKLNLKLYISSIGYIILSKKVLKTYNKFSLSDYKDWPEWWH